MQPKEPTVNQDTVDALRTALHEHRASIRNLANPLGHLHRCLSSPLPRRTETDSPSDPQFLFSAAHELEATLHAVLAQSEERVGEPGAAQLSHRLTVIGEELSHVLKTLGAESVFRLRDIATAVQEAISRARGDHRPALNKQLLKSLASVAREVEARVCLYDLTHIDDALHATLEQLTDAYDRLVGLSPGERGATVIDVVETTVDAINRWDHAAKQRNIDLRLRGKQTPANVVAPTRDLLHALNNLLDNAIKYTGRLPPGSLHERPWVSVRIKREREVITINVESWGVPFTYEEVQGQLYFNHGYRGHYARHHLRTGGSGEGLADVLRIARNLGGSVTVHTEPVAKGLPMAYRTTEVILALPAANPESQS